MAAGLELKDIESVHNLLSRITEDMMGEKVTLPPAMEAIRQDTPPPDAAEEATKWLWLLDAGIGPEHLRRAIEKMGLQPQDYTALIRYYLRKRPLRQVDIEKLEWLATYIYRSRYAAGGQVSSADMRQEIQTWVGESTSKMTGAAEALLAELVEILEDLTGCPTFRDLTQSGLIDRGRSIKQRLKEDLAQPHVLSAVINYNLVSRRKFESLLSEALGSSPLRLELSGKEYRTAAEDFRQLSAAGATPSAAAARPSAAVETEPPSSPAAAQAPPAAVPATPAAAADALAAPQKLKVMLHTLGIDTVREEGRVRTLLNELVSFALAAGKPVSTVPLPSCSLTLAPWEAQSLVLEYPALEKSFRADFNRLVRRAVALLAAIEEEKAQYELRRHSEHHWKPHVDALFYLLWSGSEALPDLENLAQQAARRGLQEKAALLADTIERLRARLSEVSNVCQQWKQSPGQKGVYGS